MSPAEEIVFSEALALPPESRARLAGELWASLPDDAELPLTDEIRHAWADEARRRMKLVQDGTVHLLPGDEVIKRLRARS